jgi:putrescine transport system permease protein
VSGFVKAVRSRLPGRGLVIGAPYLWLAIFFLVPFLLVLKISFADSDTTIPPYTPLFTLGDDSALQITLHLDNFIRLFSDDPIYLLSYLSSLRNAAVTTVFCLLIGYPMAYAIARAQPTLRPVLLMLIVLPFWTSFLIRIYAWIGILKDNGLLNNFLIWIGAIDEPLNILNTCSRRPWTWVPGRSARSGPSPCRCRCPASSRARCWCSFRRLASSSSRPCWAAPIR